MQSRVLVLGAEAQEVFSSLCEHLERRTSRKASAPLTIVRVLITELGEGAIDCAVMPLPPFSERAIRRRFHCTRMQARVARLVAARLSNEEIAQALGSREGTVRTHLNWVYTKLNAHTREDVMRLLSDPALYSDDGGG